MSHVSAPSLGTLPACVVELWDAPKGVENSFDDVDALATQCRFRDCRQESEPACAVSAAVKRGDLDAGRPANALIVMSMQTLTFARDKTVR
jgi:putative ribosome biogenesis GTPase RsgA